MVEEEGNSPEQMFNGETGPVIRHSLVSPLAIGEYNIQFWEELITYFP
jgi:hypothetical protein